MQLSLLLQFNLKRITQLRGRRRLKKKIKQKNGKKKELITEGEYSFSKLLEEGEIDEPYVPEYVEGVFTNEEAQVDEEDEFAGEYAFHNDCLLNGVEEIITTDIQEAQNVLKRKL